MVFQDVVGDDEIEATVVSVPTSSLIGGLTLRFRRVASGALYG